MRMLLFGPPGSGKGTQAAVLARELSVPAISTGDMLRSAVAARTPLGERVESIMLGGQLVDDATMAEVVRGRLEAVDACDGFVLDGYPRTLPQAEELDRILDQQGCGLDHVVVLEVPEEELVQRTLDRGRADDSTDIVRHRLREYRNKTEPLIGYYGERHLLRAVDGHQPVAAVTADVLVALGRGA